MVEDKNNEILYKFYYSLTSPAGYSSAQRLYDEVKRHGYNIRKSEVVSWLSGQKSYTLHKDRRTRFIRNFYNVTNIDDLWQIDLIDVQKLSRVNAGYRYILCVICCLSRFAWCVPIKRKIPDHVIKAFEFIFSSTTRRPIRIISDSGKEFVAKSIQQFFKQHNIIHYTAANPTTKACICERFIRTIKALIYKYFTFSNSKKYVHVLDSLVCMYNNRKHSSIGIAPSDVNEKNILSVWEYNHFKRRNRANKRCKYSIGDTVRVANPKTVFEKGYKPKWSDEVFTIDKIVYKQPIVYRLKDSSNIVIKGNFYECGIQKVNIHKS